MLYYFNSAARTVDELRRKLEEIEASFRTAPRASAGVTPSGIDPLNEILRDGGFRNGALVEWLTDGEGAGAATLAFRSVTPWLRNGETCVVIDDRGELHPASIAAMGIDFDQLLIVRPEPKDALWALEQALTCRGAAVTLAWLGHVPSSVLRRLQLAVESGGGIGMLLRPGEMRVLPGWAHLRLLVSPVPMSLESAERRLRIEVLHCKGGRSGGIAEVNVDEETGNVRSVSPLAAARDARRAT